MCVCVREREREREREEGPPLRLFTQPVCRGPIYLFMSQLQPQRLVPGPTPGWTLASRSPGDRPSVSSPSLSQPSCGLGTSFCHRLAPERQSETHRGALRRQKCRRRCQRAGSAASAAPPMGRRAQVVRVCLVVAALDAVPAVAAESLARESRAGILFPVTASPSHGPPSGSSHARPGRRAGGDVAPFAGPCRASVRDLNSFRAFRFLGKGSEDCLDTTRMQERGR